MGDVTMPIPKDHLETADLVAWLDRFATNVSKAKAHLSELDAATGDADHGANLHRGVVALGDILASKADHGTPGAFLKEVGLTFVGTVGGSSGALYGTIFLRMAATAGLDAQSIDGPTMARALEAAGQGIVDRGRARVGDKTMLDAMAPAASAFAAALDQGADIGAAFAAAAAAAESGAAATASMRARRGKSSYVGEKSIGMVDPGAASVALLIRSAADSISAAN